MARALVAGQELRFLADGIRTERTGVHATVHVFLNSDMLDFTHFNVLRSDERTKLVNKAHKRLGELFGGLYPKESFDHDLDYFCLRVSRYETEGSLAEEVAGHPYQVEFFLEPYLAAQSGTIIFARPGSTKSYLALLMAVSIDAGSCTLWKTVKRKVLFINLERSAKSMAGRLYRINRVLGLPGDRPLLMINGRGKTLNAVADGAARDIKRHQVACVWLDSISRSGGDLNDNKDANAVMDVLNGFGGAWAAVGHTSLADQTKLFGSQLFGAAADLTVQVSSERHGSITGTSLTMRKFNDVPPRETEVFALSFDDGGLTGVRRATATEFPELETDKKLSLSDQICEVMPRQGGLSVDEVYGALQDDGVKCTKESVKTTLYVGAKKGLFRNWKDGGILRWNVLNG